MVAGPWPAGVDFKDLEDVLVTVGEGARGRARDSGLEGRGRTGKGREARPGHLVTAPAEMRRALHEGEDMTGASLLGPGADGPKADAGRLEGLDSRGRVVAERLEVRALAGSSPEVETPLARVHADAEASSPDRPGAAAADVAGRRGPRGASHDDESRATARRDGVVRASFRSSPPLGRRPDARDSPTLVARPRQPALLRRGNTKLGPDLIWTFSLPAEQTCPGATDACRAACYAKKGRYAFSRIRGLYARNLEESRRGDFAARVASEVRLAAIRVVRIHGSGDFYDAGYVGRWAGVARRRPEATFYAYTRSWRLPEVRDALRGLAALPNVHLWYSADRDSGPPPRDRGVRIAWMIAAGEAPATVPIEADLAFRVRDDGPLKWANGVQVCPYEQGVGRKVPRITCDRCRICFSTPRAERTCTIGRAT